MPKRVVTRQYALRKKGKNLYPCDWTFQGTEIAIIYHQWYKNDIQSQFLYLKRYGCLQLRVQLGTTSVTSKGTNFYPFFLSV